MKGVRAGIYRWTGDDPGADFSNGGISSRCTEVTIIDPRIEGTHEPTDRAPAVRITLRAGDYACAEPIDRPEGMLGPMMGGCYVALPTPTLRQLLGSSGAIPLHDRWESPELYASLSA